MIPMLLEYVDNQEILAIIKEKTAKAYKTISREEMLKRLNIEPEELDWDVFDWIPLS